MDYSWGRHTKEYLLYAIFLGIAFLFPFLHAGEMALDEGVFQWNYILQKWAEILPFVILLLIHLWALQPILFVRKQIKRYILLTFLSVVVFFVYTYYQHDTRRPHNEPMPPFAVTLRGVERNPDEFRIPGPVVIDTFIAILLLGCSLSIKLLFKNYEDSRKMEEMENARIRQELTQLKAQISPHFFMNSLNNIHGMVEIDSQKAQDMILELSGMMRYVLYESAMPMIPLSKEIDFLSNYISLMRVRYNTNKVAIKHTFPDKDEMTSIYVPPLMLIVFIENAFKHGVDYQNSSFVNVELSVHENELTLSCVNSLHRNDKKGDVGGIGLNNIRKRLDIIYGNDYSLDTSFLDKIFIVTLTIPIKNED